MVWRPEVSTGLDRERETREDREYIIENVVG